MRGVRQAVRPEQAQDDLLHGDLPLQGPPGAAGRAGEGEAAVSDLRLFEVDGLESQIETATDELAALVIAGDRHAASPVLAGLRELVWHRRAAEVRGRRHAGPRQRSLARRAGGEGI
jgi:hypothetical protein